MSHPSTPRRVLRGPHGSIAVEIRRYTSPGGRFKVVAYEGDHVSVGSEHTLSGLLRAGWRELTEAPTEAIQSRDGVPRGGTP